MAQQYDGYIRISTKIDEKTAQKSLNNLSSSLKKFAGVVAASFGIAAITTFMKSCVTVSTELTNAWIGLQSVSEGMGYSFDKSKAFLQDYVKDGLVPVKNAVAGYKNLLLRGYDTTQIEDIMNRLKDSASFARQGSLTMGQAVQAATEGLKNELSTLVDNAGVTKNVAQMWKDYADQIGKTTAQLTRADKVAAEYAGIMYETRFQVGDAAKLVNTYSGQVSMLTFNMTMLKASIGEGFIVVLKPIVSWLNVLIQQLTVAATVFANFMTALLGASQNFTTGATDAADSVDSLTDSTEATTDAAKDAEKALAGFDELNILNTPTAAVAAEDLTATDETTAASSTADEVNKSVEEMKKKIKEFFEYYKDRISNLKSVWSEAGDSAKSFIDKLKEQFKKADIFKSLAGAAIEFGYAVGSVFNLVVSGVGDLFLALNVPAIISAGLDALKSAFKAIGDIITSITPGILNFIDVGLVPIFEWVGTKIRDALEFLAEQFAEIGDWFTANKDNITELGKKLGEVTALVWKLIEPILDVAWAAFKVTIGLIVDIFKVLGDWVMNHKQLVTDFFAIFLTFKAVRLLDDFAKLIIKLGLTTGEMLLNNAQWLILNAKLVLVNAQMFINNGYWLLLETKLKLANIQMVLNNAQWLLLEAKLAISNVLHATLNTTMLITIARIALIAAGIYLLVDLFTKIQESWKDMSTLQRVISVLGMLAIAAGVAAVAFGALQSAWSLGVAAIAIVAGTVAISAALNSAKSKAASDISSSIPKLANGAVIPPNREFIATLGDQKRGTNIEAPMETIKQGVLEVLEGLDLGGNSGPTSVNFTGSLAQLGRVLKPVVIREDKRRGTSLVEVGNS